MKIGAKRFLSLMLCCIMVLGLFPAAVFAVEDAVKTVTIPFEKVWNNDGNALGNRPEEGITVRLYKYTDTFDAENPGEPVCVQTIKGADGKWGCNFTIPESEIFVGETEQVYKFKVVEDPVTGYTETAHTDPDVTYTSFSVDEKWSEYHSCNNLSKDIQMTENKVVFVKKNTQGKDYIVWTPDVLSLEEKEKVFSAITDNVAKEFKNNFAEEKFFYGFDNNNEFKKDDMTITNDNISFGDHSNWQYLAIGSYTEEAINVTGASITNTYRGNVPTVGSLTITKSFEGLPVGTTPASVSFTITGPNSYSQTVTLSDNNQWTTTLSNLTPGGYTVSENEESAKVAGYELTADAANLLPSPPVKMLRFLSQTNTRHSNLKNRALDSSSPKLLSRAATSFPASRPLPLSLLMLKAELLRLMA